MSTAAHAWRRRLEEAIARDRPVWFDRAVVLEEAGSTQDEARLACEGRGGLILTALRQREGRGRLGRRWADTHGHGLAVTFVLDAAPFEAAFLSIAAGLAARDAMQKALPPGPRLGLRWPNDVVLREHGGGAHAKLAGILVERSGPVFLLGVGANVSQEAGDWPGAIAGRALSLRQLGSSIDRPALSIALAGAIDAYLGRRPEEIARGWEEHDVLIGTRQTFEHDGRRIEGVVEAIDPASQICVRTDSGRLERLRAMTTSLVHQHESM